MIDVNKLSAGSYIVSIEGGHLKKKKIFRGKNINPGMIGNLNRKAKLILATQATTDQEQNVDNFVKHCERIFNIQESASEKKEAEIKTAKKTVKKLEKESKKSEAPEVDEEVKGKVKQVIQAIKKHKETPTEVPKEIPQLENKEEILNQGEAPKQRKKTEQEKIFDKYLKTDDRLGIVAKAAPRISLPSLLLDRMLKFVKEDVPIKYLINFWHLCLLNPNPESRNSLFKYIVNNGLTITPSGYVVCYRRLLVHCQKGETYRDEKGVTKTATETVYTDAHTKKMRITLYDIVSIPREECDERPNVECSRGLHVGSPNFVGTNYNFGDVRIMCLVNPQHWVAVPYADGHKARVCEYYFFKIANQKDIDNLKDNDVSIFTHDYDKIFSDFEDSEIKLMFKNANIKINPSDDVAEKLAKLKNSLEILLKERGAKSLRMNEDYISDHLDPEALAEIIAERTIKKY